MSVDFSSFIFPSPGPDLLAEPKAPENSDTYARWYLESALRNSSHYPLDGFGSANADMRVRDVVQVRLEDSDLRSADWLRKVDLYCLVCLPAADGTARTGDGEGGFPWCENDTATATPLTRSNRDLHAEDWDAVTLWQNLTIEIPIPTHDRTLLETENTTLACTLFNYVYPENETDTRASEVPKTMSQIFFVSQAQRKSEYQDELYGYLSSYYPWYTYNETSLLGVPSEESVTSSVSTPTASSTPWRRPSQEEPNEESWDMWSTGKRVGLVAGLVAGTILSILLIFCWCRRLSKKEKRRMAKTSSQMPHARPQIVRPIPAELRPTPARANTTEVAEAPPPAYHEVVSDPERVRVIQRDNAGGAISPPVYSQPTTGTSAAH